MGTHSKPKHNCTRVYSKDQRVYWLYLQNMGEELQVEVWLTLEASTHWSFSPMNFFCLIIPQNLLKPNAVSQCKTEYRWLWLKSQMGVNSEGASAVHRPMVPKFVSWHRSFSKDNTPSPREASALPFSNQPEAPLLHTGTSQVSFLGLPGFRITTHLDLSGPLILVLSPKNAQTQISRSGDDSASGSLWSLQFSPLDEMLACSTRFLSYLFTAARHLLSCVTLSTSLFPQL